MSYIATGAATPTEEPCTFRRRLSDGTVTESQGVYWIKDDGTRYCGKKPAAETTLVSVTTVKPPTTVIKDFWPGMDTWAPSTFCQIVPGYYYQKLCARFIADPLKVVNYYWGSNLSARFELFKYFGYPAPGGPSDATTISIFKNKIIPSDSGKKKLAEFFRDKILPRAQAAYRKRLEACIAAGLPDDQYTSIKFGSGVKQISRARECAGFLEPYTATPAMIARVLGWPPEGTIPSTTTSTIPQDYQYYANTDSGRKQIIKAFAAQYKADTDPTSLESRNRDHTAKNCAALPLQHQECCQILSKGLGFAKYYDLYEKGDPSVVQCVQQTDAEKSAGQQKKLILIVGAVAAAAVGITLLKKKR